MLTHFDLDPDKLAVLHDCMDSYDVGDPDAEWPNNIISTKAVVYQNGVITRRDTPVVHRVDQNELSLCQSLAATVEHLMAGVDIRMGSEATVEFRRFYIVANVDDPAQNVIDASFIRHKFGGTIFPPATIVIEPLTEAGTWWHAVLRDDAESGGNYVGPWQAMVAWFKSQGAFVDTAFVRIGMRHALAQLDEAEFPAGTEMTGSALPRLAIGLTEHGSLVGLFGYIVQT